MDGSAIDGFISNLAPQERLTLGLPLPFDNLKNMLTCFFRFGKNFISSKTESWFFFKIEIIIEITIIYVTLNYSQYSNEGNFYKMAQVSEFLQLFK